MDFLRQYIADLKPAHSPAVGWLAGLAACASFALLALLLHGKLDTPLVAAIGCTIATVLLTEGSQERSLAAAFSAQGVLALVLALLMKVSLLAVLAGHSEAGVLIALFAAHTVSRFAPLAFRLRQRELAIAAAWCAPPLVLALLARGAAFTVWPLLLVALAAWLMKLLFARRADGFTADGQGATQQVCEIAFYLGAAIASG